ncbi:MAG: hypothetical protein U0573_04705 [Phycisphaerales bacterium]|nr:hypothetical protein [Planctomycetota bacterium]
MQTVQRRPFSFLGTPLLGVILLGGAAVLGGCSSARTVQATGPASGLAAGDAFAGVVTPRGTMAMAAGDQLGMAAYAQDYQLAQSNKAESTRYARRPGLKPAVALADE